MPILDDLRKLIEDLGSAEKAKHLQRFFKTGPGQYGHGDKFRGINVPPLRALARQYASGISLSNCCELLHSPYHEDRMIALFILVEQFRNGECDLQQKIYELYLANLCHVNNWDLVDLSCYHIVGKYLADKERKDLYHLAERGNGESGLKSYQQKDLWANRVAIISTFAFIRNSDFDDTLALAKILLDNKHDLIHKAVGWMLREVGKRDLAVEENYLQEYYKNMPRTMLRYAIEKFEPARRQQYLKGMI